MQMAQRNVKISEGQCRGGRAAQRALFAVKRFSVFRSRMDALWWRLRFVLFPPRFSLDGLMNFGVSLRIELG